MKRLLYLLLILVMMISVMPLGAQDMEAPDGTWFGTWPYTLPPDHHFNGFATGGPGSNLGNVYRGLVELTPAFYLWATDEYVSLLADDWGFTDDNSAYWIHINEDALWSDGSPVTSQDVITTYALGQIMGWSQFNEIDEVEAVDDHTVRFHFIDQPSRLAELLILKEFIVADSVYGELASQALEVIASGVDSESDEWTAVRTAITEFRPDTLVASGPYSYSADDVNDSFLTLHWQPNSLFSDDVQFGDIVLWAGETDATTPLVLSGEIAHSTNVYPPSTVETFLNEGIDNVTLSRGYGPAMLFNHSLYPWNVTEVRQAAALSIERSQNAFITNGFGATGTEYMAGIIDSNVPTMLTQEAIDQLDRYAFDLDRAASILESAGFSLNADGVWEDGEGVTLSAEWKFPAEFADFSGATQDAIEQLNAAGFDITARALPWQDTAEAIREGDFEISIWSWGLGNPFASRQFWNPVQRFNYTDLTDQVGMNFQMEFEYNGEMINLDEMIDNVNVGLDSELHRDRASEVALIINDLMPFVPLNVIQSIEPFNTDLISGKPAADDPILVNPSGAHHFAIYYILTGQLGPGPDQMG